MNDLYKEIAEIFKSKPEVLYGISNIDFSELKASYKCALVFAVPHSEMLSIKSYEEGKFKNLIGEARKKAMSITQEITALLDKLGIKYLVPSPEYSKETYTSQFSLKFASVNAGLGWIGKNCVLTTEKYGPRVRPNAILIDYELPAALPVTVSGCPADCQTCADMCPHDNLTGTQWNIGVERSKLIDFNSCDQKRELESGGRDSCGLCMVSCPYGV
jgi:epoxyqueuosine reductase QueG